MGKWRFKKKILKLRFYYWNTCSFVYFAYCTFKCIFYDFGLNMNSFKFMFGNIDIKDVFKLENVASK